MGIWFRVKYGLFWVTKIVKYAMALEMKGTTELKYYFVYLWGVLWIGWTISLLGFENTQSFSSICKITAICNSDAWLYFLAISSLPLGKTIWKFAYQKTSHASKSAIFCQNNKHIKTLLKIYLKQKWNITPLFRR